MDTKEIVSNELKSKKISKKRLLDEQSKTINPDFKGIREKNRGKGKSKLTKPGDRRHRLHNIADENAEEEKERRRAKSHAKIQS